MKTRQNKYLLWSVNHNPDFSKKLQTSLNFDSSRTSNWRCRINKVLIPSIKTPSKLLYKWQTIRLNVCLFVSPLKCSWDLHHPKKPLVIVAHLNPLFQRFPYLQDWSNYTRPLYRKRQKFKLTWVENISFWYTVQDTDNSKNPRIAFMFAKWCCSNSTSPSLTVWCLLRETEKIEIQWFNRICLKNNQFLPCVNFLLVQLIQSVQLFVNYLDIQNNFS